MSRLTVLAVVALVLLVPVPALAAATGAHGDPVAPVLAALAIILVAARLGGDLAARLGQPAVLGELLAGVLLGNLPLLGVSGLGFFTSDPTLDMLARIGVILVLFEVGLESTVGQMLQVGASSLLVAVLGVAAPFALGWLVGAWLLPDAGGYVHAFLGATLCATSVGITARVLQDLGRSQTPEARIILGAAVVDDVLGLVVLTVVSGLVVAADGGGSLSAGAVGLIVGRAALFLVGSLLLGVWLSPGLFRLASRLRTPGVLLAAGLSFCFLLAWLANLTGLAPIVGAFAAGLILEERHDRPFAERGERRLAEAIHPIVAFLAPVFFVLMGMRTDLRSFVQPGAPALILGLTIAAIAGKQVCGLGVVGRGVDRLSIGFGMVPRGEVGLIFASIGLTLHIGGQAIVGPVTYSAVVAMVILTTLVTPPALKWSLSRSGGSGGARDRRAHQDRE
ncbi:MAG TPA: cation:proton antiporter [Patescibacteria group bacterium]|nr:cation:proton antiporter [Patescibacteria group bacterium]